VGAWFGKCKEMLLLGLNDKTQMVAIGTICAVPNVEIFQMVLELKKNLIQ
jgi:hypothetical protein